MASAAAERRRAQCTPLSEVMCTVSASDCWAVGNTYNKTNDQTLIEHWDGISWTIASSPNTSPTVDNDLGSVACTSMGQCWAVGAYFDAGGGVYQTLTERWDGSSWTIATSPNASTTQDNLLNSVACLPDSQCWAVGINVIGLLSRTLIERWDGSGWRVVPVRRRGTLGGVWTPDGQRAWAAGPPVMRSDGSTWAPDPDPESAATFDGVSGRTTDGGVWAVGSRTVGAHAATRTAMIRWTGSRWIVASVPSPANYQNVLEGVAASEPFVWAVGYTENKTVIRKALILGVC